jgi:hypothetical protein
MGHAGGARREDRQVAAALLLQLELRLHALAQLIVRDAEIGRGGAAHGIGKPGQLLVPERQESLRLGRVVAVNVDDHEGLANGVGMRRRVRASIDNKRGGCARERRG